MDRPMEHRMTILAPLDGSSFSEAILGTVARLAQPLGARVELLLVADPALVAGQTRLPAQVLVGAAAGNGVSTAEPLRRVLTAPAGTRTVPDAGQLESALAGYLAFCAEQLPGVETSLTVDVADDPAGVIIARARQTHADLIAMATHGRSGVLHLLAGSVCERVIRSGVAPVVVLRP